MMTRVCRGARTGKPQRVSGAVRNGNRGTEISGFDGSKALQRIRLACVECNARGRRCAEMTRQRHVSKHNCPGP
jgi:hypothetical protein